MQKLSIHGGVPLQGEVRVAGAKNAALPILAAVAAHRRAAAHLQRAAAERRAARWCALLERMGVKADAGRPTRWCSMRAWWPSRSRPTTW